MRSAAELVAAHTATESAAKVVKSGEAILFIIGYLEESHGAPE
jgi:hypothetical protein